MNTNQIVNMIVRTVMRRVITSGINAGFDALSRGGSKLRRGRRADPEMHNVATEHDPVHTIRRVRQPNPWEAGKQK